MFWSVLGNKVMKVMGNWTAGSVILERFSICWFAPSGCQWLPPDFMIQAYNHRRLRHPEFKASLGKSGSSCCQFSVVATRYTGKGKKWSVESGSSRPGLTGRYPQPIWYHDSDERRLLWCWLWVPLWWASMWGTNGREAEAEWSTCRGKRQNGSSEGGEE